MEYHTEAAFQKPMGRGHQSQCLVSSLSFKTGRNFCTLALSLSCSSPWNPSHGSELVELVWEVFHQWCPSLSFFTLLLPWSLFHNLFFTKQFAQLMMHVTHPCTLSWACVVATRAEPIWKGLKCQSQHSKNLHFLHSRGKNKMWGNFSKSTLTNFCILLVLMPILLTSNSHTKQFTHLKYSVQRFWKRCGTITVNFKIFSSQGT